MDYYCPTCNSLYPAENTHSNECIFCGHKAVRVDDLIDQAEYMYGEDR
jgi:rRNA maturation endonuclease Nob1